MKLDTPDAAGSRRDFAPAIAVGLLALAWASVNAWLEQRGRVLPLDVDGWGHLVNRLQSSGHDWALLFREPSLWKGPVVPFIFGLCYYVAPWPESVLVLNAFAFALAAFVYCLAFQELGATRWGAAAALVPAILYLPHRYVFGYYVAEPIYTLLAALLLWSVGRTARRGSLAGTFGCGVLAALLLQARAPFVFVVAGLGLWLVLRLPRRRWTTAALYALGFLLAFAPWPVRNYLVEGELIPFTTEGGKILFQGTFLPGDDLTMNEIRKLPEFRRIEAGEEGLAAVDQYRYWKPLAIAQLRQDPLAQIQLCVRKAARFWVYLPAHSWRPTWKTGFLAFLVLPLALVGLIRYRHSAWAQLSGLFVGGLWSFHTLVHTELRYNFPVLPTVFLLAVFGGTYLLSRIRVTIRTAIAVNAA